jgi:hypothetical protein
MAYAKVWGVEDAAPINTPTWLHTPARGYLAK